MNILYTVNTSTFKIESEEYDYIDERGRPRKKNENPFFGDHYVVMHPSIHPFFLSAADAEKHKLKMIDEAKTRLQKYVLEINTVIESMDGNLDFELDPLKPPYPNGIAASIMKRGFNINIQHR